MGEKEIRLNLSLGPEIGEIPLDPGRFQQLVLNLVSNAIEASPLGGAIDLETGRFHPERESGRKRGNWHRLDILN